jgi:hypothetical protein
MLLLIRFRYPALANVLGLVAALAFAAVGVATSHPTMVIMSAASVALSIVQIRHGRRSGSSRAAR